MCKLTTCCCCIPLRAGLFISGGSNLLLFLIPIMGLYWNSDKNQHGNTNAMTSKQNNSIIGFGVIDLLFTIILVVAAYKRHANLMKVYFVYSIIVSLLFLAVTGVILYQIILIDVYLVLYYLVMLTKTRYFVYVTFVIVAIASLFRVYTVGLVASAIEQFENYRHQVEFNKNHASP